MGALEGPPENIKQAQQHVEFLASHMMTEINDNLKAKGMPPIPPESVLKDYVDKNGIYHSLVHAWTYKTGMISGFKGLIETEEKKKNRDQLMRKMSKAVDPIVVDALQKWPFIKTEKNKWMPNKQWQAESRAAAEKIMAAIKAKGGFYSAEEILDEYIRIGAKNHPNVTNKVLESGIYSTFQNLVAEEKAKKAAEKKRKEFLKAKGMNIEDTLSKAVAAIKAKEQAKKEAEKRKAEAKAGLDSLLKKGFNEIDGTEKGKKDAQALEQKLESKAPKISTKIAGMIKGRKERNK